MDRDAKSNEQLVALATRDEVPFWFFYPWKMLETDEASRTYSVQIWRLGYVFVVAFLRVIWMKNHGHENTRHSI